MFIALQQVEQSIAQLSSFHPFFGITYLVCKAAELPVGKMAHFAINAEEEKFLQEHYKPDFRSEYYFQPFRTSSRERRWLSHKYPWSGSQSTRTRGDLAQAFLHKKGTDQWGWARDYVRILGEKLDRDKSGRVSALWLAIWIFRERDWAAQTTEADLVRTFFQEFHINREEQNELFQPLREGVEQPFLVDEPYSDARLLKVIERAPDAPPEEGGTLRSLEMRGVGPNRSIDFYPGERLTIVTGDNGLGKSFLLECTWWALTGFWADQPASPRSDAARSEPSITFEIAGAESPAQGKTIKYDWERQAWPSTKGRPTIPGLIVYARVDGSSAVWDPIRHSSDLAGTERFGRPAPLLFSRDDVLHGLEGRIEGLLRDWVKWQHSPDRSVFDTFKSVLARLSPPDMNPLVPGEPVRMPHEPREIPTLSHPYGIVPLTHESAGIKRIASVAYLLVWAWNEHKIAANLAKRQPQQKMVILIDEMEAHLHPRWQRSVLPAVLDVTAILSRNVEPQLIVTTHSPMVLASVETRFSDESDVLYHLDLSEQGQVSLAPMPFVRHGTVDAWLTSDVFALRQARSREGEQAIEKAKRLMEDTHSTAEQIKAAHAELARALAEDDEFWPRWGYFADRKRVRL